MVQEAVRDAVEPLSARALAWALAARRGLPDITDVLAAVQKTALAVLRRLVDKGVVRSQAPADATRVWQRGLAVS